MTHKKPKIKLRSIYLWHRYIGVTVALLVLLLSITCILLNHTEELNLDSRYLTSDALLDWYSIGEVGPVTSYSAGEYQVSQVSRHLYINTHRLEGEYAQLRGAVVSDDLILVALGNTVLMLTEDGELVDQLSPPIPASAEINNIGSITSKYIPVLQTTEGLYKTNQQLTRWQKIPATSEIISWSSSQTPAEQIHAEINSHEREHILDMERFLLDLHSGRILGNTGVWLMDIAAILMILLAVSGLFLWLKQRFKRKQHKHR